MTQQTRQDAKLREIIAKEASAAGAPGTVSLEYTRGHELSGVTRFHVAADGQYTLDANHPKKGKVWSFKGALDATQRAALLKAMEDVIGVEGSTRNIGDSEQPVALKITSDDHNYGLDIWAGDARENPRFHGFEVHLHALFEKLSNGEMTPRVRPLQ